jgi:ABC-type uncharacterized transport system substrate-binding protein
MYRNTTIVLALAVLVLAAPARAQDAVSPLQQLFVLKEIRPELERVGIIWNKDSADRSGLMTQVERAAATTGVRIFVAYASGVTDIATAYRELVRQNNIQAVWVVDAADDIVGSRMGRDFLIKNTASSGLTLVAPATDWVEAGAHMTFVREGANIRLRVNRRAADAARLVIPANILERTDFLAAN